MDYFYRKFKISTSLVLLAYGLKTIDMCVKDFNSVDQIWFVIGCLAIAYGGFLLDDYIKIVKHS